MPISSPAISKGRHPAGFTLFELMIVLAIIGLAATAVVVNLPDPASRLADDAARFAARVNAARDDAVIQSRPMQVTVTASGYGFARRVAGQWQPIDAKPFVTTDWRRGASALVGPAGRLRLVFDGTGAAVAPIEVVLVRNDARARVSVGLDGKVALR